ncbi:alpha/beta fold hydrolase [Rhodospira trueperi]|uniref:Pimeloyl-ACP methyl ester carboxylesterase n=1 Tax=Rhodospira trueperi TaxID=69960 RepID=A0A1G7AWE8_9PROT|nr:alpha/beta hydrolase [Rhodospira trueperi]SDE18325.1 Pimeloyl-ACP methyl ester carboxylesterase [Rhodospira trueperi]
MTHDAALSPDAPRRLTRPDGATIAYHATPGKGPGVVFIHGFMSDMTGGKALHLEAWARRTGRAFVRFDQRGHGQSDGRFEDGTIGAWADDLIQVLDHVTEGPQVLVGSSMGGWLTLLAARARPGRVAALVGIAAAPDFTEELMWSVFDDAARATLERDGVLRVPSEYGDEPYPITKRLIDEGRDHLLLGGPIPIRCPARLIQGMRDESVPWQTAQRILERLDSDDVEATFIKSGDHRLSEPHDLARLERTVEGVMRDLEGHA